ncbi:potassium channel family protein [Tepidiforma thermophila]|jgi:trk system potassium uptake protein TrkA|uniref:Trk system potassium uptake protein TrkA n=1 Tax=Tepidiforma thermophila (strain KCTC 52669 / CGMCC 1.13589 / G233) TaxID=2761530 RepID=A0A2A9HEV9_TEPT2|nr:TrkA family potassium uptake protein [Tepidiforma thermophila]PFG74557.1 trk system potassium uptake protein TrkA [Tepidiforma thermophila]
MNVVIMGCGRLGARIASMLERQGHAVTIIDITETAFRRLPEGFGGRRIVGNGMDQKTLERAGIENADAFFAVTQGDNRNYFASQVAREIYGVRRVLCRVYDPVREGIFRDLGLETFSPTSYGAQIMVDMLLNEPTRR